MRCPPTFWTISIFIAKQRGEITVTCRQVRVLSRKFGQGAASGPAAGVAYSAAQTLWLD